MNKLLILSIAGVVISATLGLYFDNAWFGLWFLFSIALGNVAGEREKEEAEEKKKNATEFATFVTWKTFVKPLKHYKEDNTIGRPLVYHYPQAPGQGLDVRTHTYQYTVEEIYSFYLKDKEKKS